MSDLVKVAARPLMKLGHFALTDQGVTIRGVPTREQFVDVFEMVSRVEKASGWWLVDLITYADSREADYGELENLIDLSTIPEGTLKKYRLVGREFPAERRLSGASMSHHMETLPLPPDERAEVLAEAATAHWSHRETRVVVRAKRRSRVISGQAVLKGRYRVILADPPWAYNDSGPTEDGSLGKAERHYAPLSIEHLAAMPILQHAMPNSVLFLWVTTPMLWQSPGPIDVMAAWGFDYKSELVWDKVLGMPGSYGLHITHEHLIIATRGQGGPDVPTPEIKSILVERRSLVHSGKPASVRQWIESRWTTGPYLELFARERHDGWDAYGDDPKLLTAGGDTAA